MTRGLDLWVAGDLGAWFIAWLRARHATSAEVASIRSSAELAAWPLSHPPAPGIRCGDDINEVEPTGRVALLVHNPTILKPATLARYERVYNVHPGFLPYGRGFYPVPWAIIEESPAGATLHEVNEGIDKGGVVAQTRVEVLATDTAQTLHARVREAERGLLAAWFDRLVEVAHGRAAPPPARVATERGTYHAKADFEALRTRYATMLPRPDLPRLLRLARAFTFPPHPGLVVDGFTLAVQPLTRG